MPQSIFYEDLGIQPYKNTWDYQEALLAKNTAIKKTIALNTHSNQEKIESTQNHFLFVEHNPVFTLGRNGDKQNILVSESFLQTQGIEFYHINRGGDITFHGLEQIVGYPILDLEKFKPDLGWYLRSLEEVIIQTLLEFNIQGERSKGETGVWLHSSDATKARKICAMGIKCSRWITMHGFALNVNTNLDYFNYIIPCGISNKKITSIEKELGYKVPTIEVKKIIIQKFAQIFNCSFVYLTKK